MKRVSAICLIFLSGFFISLSHAADSASEKEIQGLMLLDNYQPGQSLIGWLMSEKLDGVRAYWNGKQLLSRNGNAFAAPEWFTADFPDFPLDGELWMDRNRFSETVSVVKQKTPHMGWIKIGYYIFDAPSQEGGLIKRLSQVHRFLGGHYSSYLHVIPQTKILSEEHFKGRLNLVLAQGGEGLVVRRGDLPYQDGRSSAALKVKAKQDAECIVKGYKPGQGRFQGMVGSLRCELLPDQQKRLFPQLKDEPVQIYIGSGLNDEQRKIPPQVGLVITFQYMGTTRNGLPRFPVFLRVRDQ
ncbi:DNA ligase [Thiomicrorhabdus heinhorstiae]|uniref:DNA ligase n=1 Tax=Thiomicrorhabdus heinhorstiae TaxID=2748010 RepID=A0ABS0BW21_9GAMM|nr:DNA ligase [Thiomicrorhabdus heinhorstiae]MBF6057260.1 DNA ligase [Thiomicrorhabdus heinhorstiae]